ncbi:hypothetical protein PFISCL1PPCAC_114, partial [Pristionchus fissidentatus]
RVAHAGIGSGVSGELRCATKLEQLIEQQWPHDVWPEVFVCDKAVDLRRGFRSTSEHRKSSTDHKSSLVCKTCHGYLEEEKREETMKRSNDSEENDAPPIKRRQE